MSFYRDTYLKSEDWRNLRAAILAARSPDSRCEICGQKARLDVHHIQYRKLWDVVPSDLRATCRPCHDKIHEFLRSRPSWWHKRPYRVRWTKVLHQLQTAHSYIQRQWGRAHARVRRLRKDEHTVPETLAYAEDIRRRLGNWVDLGRIY